MPRDAETGSADGPAEHDDDDSLAAGTASCPVSVTTAGHTHVSTGIRRQLLVTTVYI